MRLVLRRRDRHEPQLRPAGRAERDAHGDAAEPGREEGLAPERRQRAEPLHEDCLDDVVHVRRGPHQAVDQPVHARDVQPEQRAKGVALPPPRPLDEGRGIERGGLWLPSHVLIVAHRDRRVSSWIQKVATRSPASSASSSREVSRTGSPRTVYRSAGEHGERRGSEVQGDRRGDADRQGRVGAQGRLPTARSTGRRWWPAPSLRRGGG